MEGPTVRLLLQLLTIFFLSFFTRFDACVFFLFPFTLSGFFFFLLIWVSFFLLLLLLSLGSVIWSGFLFFSSSSSSFNRFDDLVFFFFFFFCYWVWWYWKKKKAAPSDRYGAHKQCEKYWVMTSEWWCQTGRVFWVMSDGNWMIKKMDPNTTLTTLPNKPKFLSLSQKKKKKKIKFISKKKTLGDREKRNHTTWDQAVIFMAK